MGLRTLGFLQKLPWLGLLTSSILPTASGQDMSRVRQTIQTLTAPAMHGRGYVHQGDQRAARYLSNRFQALGLQAFAPTPTYSQPFSISVNTFPGFLLLQKGRSHLQPGTDFIAEPASGGGTFEGPAVELDTLVFTEPATRQRFLAQPLQGKLVVLRQRDFMRLSKLPDALHHLDQAKVRIILVPGKLTASIAQEQASQIRLQVLASKWPALAKGNIRVKVDAQLQPAYVTQNLIGYVRGRTQPDSFLVVTAHYDHIGQMGKHTYFPGANDNASGTAMLLELADRKSVV